MISIKGLLRKEEVKTYPKKDGTTGTSKTVYIEPIGEISSIAVGIPPEMKVGKQGEVVIINGLSLFPYIYEDGKRKRTELSVYIPNTN
ncbi:hypothetical protein ISS03_04210 [Patescibacteria group bacterium]|nr:hypothetical protein [Patescibacteria group bacterium]